MFCQAKSLVSEFKAASQLLNPVSLVKFDAVEIRSSKEGECEVWLEMIQPTDTPDILKIVFN